MEVYISIMNQEVGNGFTQLELEQAATIIQQGGAAAARSLVGLSEGSW